MKTIITISRYWHKPKIMSVVWGEGISMSIDVDDFKKALKQEIGSVRWIFKNSTFDAVIESAFQRVVEKIKEESAKTVI